MTTIAYRDGILAADTQMTLNNCVDGTQIKIVRRGLVMAAASGTAAMCQQFRDWFIMGMDGDPPPAQHSQNPDWNYWGLLFHGATILCWQAPGWVRIVAPYFAMGSGGDYATGAMAFGATSEEAILAAMKHDTSTGGEVTVLGHKSGVSA